MTELSDDQLVHLISKDDEVFKVSAKAACVSELVKDIVKEKEEEDEDGDNKVTEVPVPRVGSACLKKVVEFMLANEEEKMKEIPTPLNGASFNEVMDQERYQKFVADENLSQDMLFDLLTAANFMGIKPLLELTCLKVTFQLTGKDTEEIRQILRLPVLTPEEEAQAREDHKWIFEDS